MRKHKRTSRWSGIFEALGFGRREKSCKSGCGGSCGARRKSLSLEPLESRELLSIWTGSGGSNHLWSNPANWDTVPTSGADLVFQGTGVATQNDLAAGMSFHSIEFANSNFSITAANDGSAHNIALTSGVTVDSNVANSAIALDVALGGSATVSVATLESLTISGKLSDGGTARSVTKTGPGVLTLSGTDSYTGGTIISAGTLQLGNASALGSTTNAVLVNGGTLDVNSYSPTIGTLTLVSGTVSNTGGAGVLNASSYVVESGNISANLVGTGSTLTKITATGNDTVTLTGNDFYTGLTTVQGGTLEFGCNAQYVAFHLGGISIGCGELVFDYNGSASPLSSINAAINSTHMLTSTNTNSSDVWAEIDDGSTKVTVARTLPGDVNLDWTVNGADLNTVLSNYNRTGMTWFQGDTNGDNVVNGADLNTLLSNYNQTATSPASRSPTVTQISCFGSASTSGNSVQFVVAFSEGVSGVEAGDFTAVPTNTVSSAASIQSVVPYDAGAVYLRHGQ